MKPSRPFIDYKGCKIYHSFKGAQALTWWYALTPNHQAENDSADFDVRTLPKKYHAGLSLEADPDLSYENQLAECKTVIQRAIDDGFDFNTATGKLPNGRIATIRSRFKWF